MPVEIRELVIRAVTTLEADDSEKTKDVPEPSGVPAVSDNTEAIIQACVRQVLRILEKKKER